MTDVASCDMEKPKGSAERAGGRMARLLLGQRVRALWVVAVFGWILFAAFRCGLLLAIHRTLEGLTLREVLWCFLVGMRYDAVPIGYALLPLVLVLSLAPSRLFESTRFRRAVTLYVTAAVVLAVFAEGVGAAFFLDLGLRLNWMALSYLRHPREVLSHIWITYPVWLFVPLMVAVAYLAHRALKRVLWSGAVPNGPRWARLAQAGVLTLMCVLACRGGLSHEPIRTGSAYLSANNLINQLTMNNFFTLSTAARSTLNEGKEEPALFAFPPAQEAQRLTTEMLLQPQDALAHSPYSPLWRATDTGVARDDFNVVIIVMEGQSGRPVGALGYSPSYTPRLDALCEEGLFFERMYAVGERTSRAMMGVLCGHPDMGGVSILERKHAVGRFLTLPGIFRDRGYRTLFVYGGDPNFDNMRGFFTAGGIEEIIGQADMHAEELTGNWGVADEVIFRKAHERLLEMGARKFFAVILTVTNHKPYEAVPAGRVELLPAEDANEDNRRLNAYRYADWALGEFFLYARMAPYFQRTIFVVVADHGHALDPTRIVDVPGYRVPCLIYAPGLPNVVPVGRVTTVASQTDVPPTLLALLGGRYEHCFLGRNILAVQEDDGFAFLHEDDRLGFVRGDRSLVLHPGPRQEAVPKLFHTDLFHMGAIGSAKADPEEIHTLQQRMLSYYTMARELYFRGAYCDPAKARRNHAATTQAQR